MKSTQIGQLWVIEGADGVGKATQAKLLVKRLNQSGALHGRIAHHLSFPHYQEKPWGVLIRQYLDGVFGSLDSVGPYPTSLLFAADRGQHAAEMRGVLAKGDWVICDRFIASNVAFQSAKIIDATAKKQFVRWLFKTEYNLFNVPDPDDVIVLTLPIDVSHRRTEARRSEAKSRGESLNDKVGSDDIHEQNTGYMECVMQEYVTLAKQFDWTIVDCAPGNVELSREELANQIWKIVSSQLPK